MQNCSNESSSINAIFYIITVAAAAAPAGVEAGGAARVAAGAVAFAAIPLRQMSMQLVAKG